MRKRALLLVCIYRLGMGNRFVIRDHQITASSSYHAAHLQPHMGRLGNPWGSWCVRRHHRGPHHLQIDLGMLMGDFVLLSPI